MSVRYAILGLLAQKPRHGYELRSAFEAVVGGDANWEVKPAQIYTTLERLEEADLVERTSDLGEGDEPSRRVYAVTGSGHAALKEWFAQGVTPDHQRDEFFVKLMTALVSGEGKLDRIIQTQRAHLFQELHAATSLRDSYNPRTEMAQILLLDKAVMHLEADLRWLDMAEMRLEEVKGQPLPEPEIRRRGRPRKVITDSGDPPRQTAVSRKQ
ncbi:MAG: helix-turn-helix transcriptional regulator [Chloroflexi bacterium]|nr:helix-turn-helix transcriptional regulator [Chloroflexota bacterium]MBE3117876.1 helix-turn-helix transcriptional regulator [Candidatus Atribacteria bacterium]